jgi:CRP/FNR family transcriptional regulator
MGHGTELELALEDPLNYLPRKPIQEFPKRSLIYDAHQPCNGLYVVMLGRVKVVSAAQDGLVTVSRIVCDEGLFGESALIGADNGESAVTLDDTSIMHWSRGEIEQQIEREPRLGIALSQFLVRQCIELQDRIESMAVQKTPERVMLALLQLANTVGKPTGDGAVRIGSLTHQTLAEYVGTSREIVTFQLNRLRRLGLLRYSRQFIDIYTRAVEQTLHQQGIHYMEPLRTKARVLNSVGA